MTADPLLLVPEVDRATQRLRATARTLDGAGLAAPSLLPGWTRGHVLAHVARNADSYINLLTWARTGVETPQYPSAEHRDADIEAGAKRPLDEQLDDLAASATRLAEAFTAMPPSAWAARVQGRGAPPRSAANLVWSRLREVEVHHVDLGAGYGPADWPGAFTRRLLHELAAGFTEAPPLRLTATDLDRVFTVGTGMASTTVSGPGAAIAAWLIGRSDGTGVSASPDGGLPAVPTWK